MSTNSSNNSNDPTWNVPGGFFDVCKGNMLCTYESARALT